MIDIENICYNCFTEKTGEATCSKCGYNNEQNALQFPTALRAGSVLNGQYIIGRVLGQGGFGITYLAMDYNLRLKVAIKEYMPDGMATRLPDSSQVTVYYGEKEENFKYGAERFLDEARVLAKFVGNKNIANVRTYFTENNTSYFVMDFIEGISFKSYLKNQGGHVSYQKAIEVLVPVLDALAPVHGEGFIHRDVTPDNIYITLQNEVKLLDFGSARYSLGNKSKSLDVILKAGYAPKEQYMRRGKQGPYTDIYSLAACFYAAISGYLPPEALERMENDEIVKLGENGVAIPPELEEVILKGLAVQPEDRYQSAEEFKAAILGAVGIAQETPLVASPANVQGQMPPAPMPSMAVAAAPVTDSAQPETALAESANAAMEPNKPPQAQGTQLSAPAGKMAEQAKSFLAKIHLEKITEGAKKAKAFLLGLPRKWLYIGSGVAALLLVTVVVVAVNGNKTPPVMMASNNGGPSIPSVLDGTAPTSSAPESSSVPEEVPVEPYTLDYRIPCRFDYAEVFIDGYARMQDGDKWGYINTAGDIVVDPIYDNLAYYYDDYVIFNNNNKFGYLDRSGDVAIDAIYTNAFNFSDGMAAVGTSDGKYFFIDKNGDQLFGSQTFLYASSFVEGYAPVTTSRGATFLDTKGRLGARYFDQVGNFSGGLAPVMKDNRWGYVDYSMNIVVPTQYVSAGKFVDGFAVVEDSNGMYHINQSGDVVDKQRWEKAWNFSEGLATVFQDGYYGYTTQTGAVAVEPHYEDVWSFHEGLCPVKLGSTWVYINKDDEVILDNGWKEAYNFTSGFAKVKKGSGYGLIDLEGNEVLPYDFEELMDFADGLLPVKKNGKWGYYAITKNSGATGSVASSSSSSSSTVSVTAGNWKTAYLNALKEPFMQNNQKCLDFEEKYPDEYDWTFSKIRLIESIHGNEIPQLEFEYSLGDGGPETTGTTIWEIKEEKMYESMGYLSYYMGDGIITYTVETSFDSIVKIRQWKNGNVMDMIVDNGSNLTPAEFAKSKGWNLGAPAGVVEWEVDVLFDNWEEARELLLKLMEISEEKFA